jgi:hypothetical protein
MLCAAAGGSIKRWDEANLASDGYGL